MSPPTSNATDASSARPSTSGVRRRREEPPGRRSRIEMARGDRNEKNPTITTIKGRKHPLNFVVSRYQVEQHENFERCPSKMPKLAWGVERSEAQRWWPRPKRCGAL